MALINKFHSIFLQVFLIFSSTLFIIFGYPIIFSILLTCWMYKQWATMQAKKDPKIGNVLEGIDGLLAGQDPYQDPLVVLMPCYFLASKLDIATVVKIVQEKLIASKIYPELTQRIVRKYGYHFWYSIDNFKIENHVRYLKPNCPNMPVTRAELRDMVTNKLGKLPFDSTKSPWEILVVPNAIDDRDPEVKSVFMLRVNHCLMDGYSIVNFTKKTAFKPWKTLGGEKTEEKRRSKKLAEIYKFVMLFFLGPYHYLKMFVFSMDSHKFVQNTFKADFEEFYNTQCTPVVSDTRLKAIKNAYGVSMSSLFTTLCAQATWKSTRRAGVCVPKTIHCLLSFPVPGHQDVLSNHWSLVRIPIKVNRTDPRKTLKFVEKEFKNLRNSVKPLVFFYANKMLALVPLCLRPNFKTVTPTTFLINNFPGPVDPSDVFGCMMKHFFLGGRMSQGISFALGSFSLAGKFWFDAAAPVYNLPKQEDTEFLSNSIMATLTSLETGIALNSNEN